MTDVLGTAGEIALREQVVAFARGLPGVEVDGDQHLNFVVRRKKFAYYLVDHHGDGRIAIHCRAAPGENELRASVDPDRFFIPPYLGPRGWLGYYLDTTEVQWAEVEALLRTAYLLADPATLARQVAGNR